jgi:GNAT superfamily N-acetyltransferase
MPSLTPQLIAAADTWPVRHRAMWPDRPLSHVQLPHDAQGAHWGLVVDGQVVAVVSLFAEGSAVQFRKFATLPEHQGRGYGTALLRHVMAETARQGASVLWCHARCTATSFYQRLGFRATGEPFARDGLEYVRMEVRWEQSGVSH